MQIHTFAAKGSAADVQAEIDREDGMLTVTFPWQQAAAHEDVSPGDGAVVQLADPGDKSAWIGDVLDVEHEPGYPMTVMIGIR